MTLILPWNESLHQTRGATTILSEVVKQSDPGRGDKWAQMGRDLVTNFVSGAALLAIQATALTPPPM